MVEKSIILIGGGGHCKSVIDVIEHQGYYRIKGVIDTQDKVGTFVEGYEIIGTDYDLERLVNVHKNFVITIGHIKSNRARVSVFNKLKKLGAYLPVIISGRAYVSKRAVINEGTVIMHNVVINSGVSVGVNCIINTSAIIEHETLVGDHVHISTGATINGSCIVGDNCFLGSNSVINQSVKIGNSTIVGSGTVVIHDTEDYSLYVGNPGKTKKKHD